MRIVRSYRIGADEADDIVQETRINAWRHLAQVRSADRFDAWLDAICRNQCRMYLRAQQSVRRHISQPSACAGPAPWDQASASAMPPCEEDGLREPLAEDPYDELERGELAHLLERAMSHLPAHTRAALDLRYLQGRSLADIAATLDTSLAAQETRLRRARAVLRQTLLGPLREEAAALGLAPAAGADDGQAPWRTTRITCYLCGCRSLEGRFEPIPGRPNELRLRCPACSPRYGMDVFRSKGIAPLDDLRAFRPALKRSMRALDANAQRALASTRDTCLHCGAPVHRQIVTPDAFPAALPTALRRHWLVAPCPRPGCPGLGAWLLAEPALWSDSAARQFMAQHPRWVLASEDELNWHGRLAIRVHMADIAGAAQLSVLVDRATLRVLATDGA